MKAQPSVKRTPIKVLAEQVVKEIRRQIRRHFLAQDNIRIVLDGLRREARPLKEGAGATTNELSAFEGLEMS